MVTEFEIEEDITNNSNLNSNYDEERSFIIPSEEPKREQGTDETELIATYVQLDSIVTKIGKPLTNLMMFNFYLLPRINISATDKNRLEYFIAQNISKIPQVEYIFFSKRDTFYEIWTVINKLDREIRKKIYDIEFNILQKFKDLYFDFHIICRNDRDINELSSSKSKMIFKRNI